MSACRESSSFAATRRPDGLSLGPSWPGLCAALFVVANQPGLGAVPARGCRSGFQTLLPLSPNLISASSATVASRAAKLGRSGIRRCTAAIRARAWSLAFSAEATAASPGSSRSIAMPLGNEYLMRRAISDRSRTTKRPSRRSISGVRPNNKPSSVKASPRLSAAFSLKRQIG
jgi:hypothetical protein